MNQWSAQDLRRGRGRQHARAERSMRYFHGTPSRRPERRKEQHWIGWSRRPQPYWATGEGRGLTTFAPLDQGGTRQWARTQGKRSTRQAVLSGLGLRANHLAGHSSLGVGSLDGPGCLQSPLHFRHACFRGSLVVFRLYHGHLWRVGSGCGLLLYLFLIHKVQISHNRAIRYPSVDHT